MPYKNLEDRRAHTKRYYNDGPGKEQHRIYHLALKLSCFDAYGGPVCKHCGFTDHRALNLDHIAGGGNIEREASSSNTIYLKLKKLNYPPGYQVLCANCNSIKKYTNNEWGRKQRGR